jgi:alanyl-tRNA synthetase
VTERLYYHDPYVREFEAAVVEVSSRDGRPVVVLDRTAFYSSSGGQPFDTGTLGSARVLDVVDDEDGRVLHVVDRDPGERIVRGSIDWPRRFDHMQQHTGQHVLSAAFDHLFGVRTESFHLGAEVSTIDLAREVSPREIAAAEDEANRVVWEDRPVEIRFAGPEEAAKLRLRKESKREGTLRLIDVTGFDLSACGGTHVSRTGAIGIVAAAAAERFRGGTRLTFVCGGRALREYRTLRDAIAGSVRTLSVLPAELPAAIERVQGDAKELRRQVKDLQGRLAEHEAASLAADAEAVGAVRLVCASRPGWDMSALKILASRVAERPGFAAVLVGEPPPCTIVIACGNAAALDAASLVEALIARYGGKGGGRPDLAQGGGLDAPAAAVLASARALVAEGGGERS